MKFFSKKPPKTTLKNLTKIPHLEKVLFWFLKNDPLFGELKNDNVRIFFEEGYGREVSSDIHLLFLKEPVENQNIFRYLTMLTWRDLINIIESMKTIENNNCLAKDVFKKEISLIGNKTDEALQSVYRISQNNNIDSSNFTREDVLSLEPLARTSFKIAFVEDAIISSELRLLAWIYRDLFREEFKI